MKCGRRSAARRLDRAFTGCALLAAALTAAPVAAYDWLQFNGDAAHSGNNTVESTLNAGNVAQLAQKYQVGLPAIVDGAPVFLQGVATSAGLKDLLFVTTTAGHIIAVDAANGAQVWSHQNGPNGCVDSNGSTCFTTSSPAIDPNRQYVYSYGLEGNVHKYQVGDGTEILTGGWPQVTTLKGTTEKGSSALATAISGGTSYLYVAHGGYPGDAGDYQGHVTVINLATGAQKVFNAMCSDQTVHLGTSTPNCVGKQTAIWSRPGVIYDAGTDRVFFGTGNSVNGGYDAVKYWSESVLAIRPDGTGAGGKPLDSFTPASHQSLDSSDSDLGSTAPAILPVPAISNVQHVALQGGKDQLLRLINLSDLGGQGGPGHIGGEVQAAFGVPQGGLVLSQPAVWVNPADASTWVFVTTGNGIGALRLAVDGSGKPSLAAQWHAGPGGASPLVANNVVYYAGGGAVRAFNPTTGALLWTGSGVGSTHWQSPIVANGAVYVTGGSNLTAFALTASAPVFTSGGAATFQIGVAQSFSVTAAGTPAPTLSEIGSVTPPSGVTFTVSSGVLAGTPGPSAVGSYALQFKASNGVQPDATQNFTLTVSAAPSGPASVTFTDPACPSFVVSGIPPAQTLSCAGGGSVPACAPTANPAKPASGSSTTINSNCSSQPTSYLWAGGKCAGVTTPSCTVSKTGAGSVTYTVTATNAAGASAPAQLTITWH